MYTNDHINECVVRVKSQVQQPSLSEDIEQGRDSPTWKFISVFDSFSNIHFERQESK